MEYFDMHAHHKCFGIENIDYPAKTPDRWFSVGVHPWYLTFENKKDYINYVLTNSENTYCKAIGECGLDKICNTDFELQKDVFVEMIDISEKKKKPLIIHCVKAFNEIIELHKKLKPAQKWIIHGFRGKPELAKILTDIGIMLSFGEYYNIQSLKETPIKCIFIETDDKEIDIKELYRKAALIKHIPLSEFIKDTTYKRLF